MRSDDSIQISLTFLYAAALLGPPLPGPVTYLRSGLARTSAARPFTYLLTCDDVSGMAETAGIPIVSKNSGRFFTLQRPCLDLHCQAPLLTYAAALLGPPLPGHLLTYYLRCSPAMMNRRRPEADRFEELRKGEDS